LLGKEKEAKKAKGKKEKYVKPSDIACTALDTYMAHLAADPMAAEGLEAKARALRALVLEVSVTL
jgi:hypothetical protein